MTAAQRIAIQAALLAGEISAAELIREFRHVSMLDTSADASLALIHLAMAEVGMAPSFDADGRELATKEAA